MALLISCLSLILLGHLAPATPCFYRIPPFQLHHPLIPRALMGTLSEVVLGVCLTLPLD